MAVVLKLIVLLIVVSGGNSLAMKIKCSDEIAVGTTVWNCSDSNISEFPSLSIHPGIEILDFSFNQIKHIPQIDQERTDKKCSGHIQKLHLQHNQIQSLDNDTFYNLNCLKYLDLSYNQLSGVDFNENTFHGLLNLITLNISYNPLMILKNFLTEHSSVAILNHFEAVNCQLETIEPESFKQLSFLRIMNLSHNSLSSVNSHLFNNLNFLCRLDLSSNKLTDITNQTFYPLLALKHLHLDSNQISNIQDGAFHGLTRMSHLSLRNNTLSKFPFEPLRPAIALKELDISANLITSFNKYSGNVFRTKIELLRMVDMPRLRYIGAHSTTVFPHLKYLYLRYNHALNKIAPEAFTESFKSLQYVYINDNGLTTIDRDTFPWSSLLDLDWSGNPWACDCYLKWVVTFHSVNKTLKCAIVGCFLTEDYFLERSGVFLLFDLLELVPKTMYNLILGCLLDLCENPKTMNHVLTWRGKDSSTAAHLLCHIWRKEDLDVGALRESTGAIADTKKPLMGKMQMESEVIPLPANCPSQAIVDVFENLRAKIYSIFCKLGFSDLPGLSVEDHVTLTIIEKYLDFKMGEVWIEVISELEVEKVRPVTPDEEALGTIVKVIEERSNIVAATQVELLEAELNQEALDEQEFYAEIRENHRQQENQIRNFSEFVSRTSNFDILKAAKERQIQSIEGSRILPKHKEERQEIFHNTDLANLHLTAFSGRHIAVDSTPKVSTNTAPLYDPQLIPMVLPQPVVLRNLTV